MVVTNLFIELLNLTLYSLCILEGRCKGDGNASAELVFTITLSPFRRCVLFVLKMFSAAKVKRKSVLEVTKHCRRFFLIYVK